MNLAPSDIAVMEAARGERIHSNPERGLDNQRTFSNVNAERLHTITEDHIGRVRNNEINRLPDVGDLKEFLNDYPFFRVHGVFHNLQFEEAVEVYITGIEFVPQKNLSLTGLGGEDLEVLRRRFTELFHTADYLHIEDTELSAEYYFDRLIEASNP